MDDASVDVGPEAKPRDVCVVTAPGVMLLVNVAVGVDGAAESTTTVVGAEAGEVHSGRPLMVCVAVIVHEPSTRLPKSHEALPGAGPASFACHR